MKFFTLQRLLIGVLLGAIIVRFLHIASYFQFGLDEEYPTLLAWQQVKNFHITLIGVSASNIGFYLGSGLTYVEWILLRLSHGDPLLLGYFASLLGALTVISLFYIVSRLYNQYVALLITTLYGFSALVVFYNRIYWPLGVALVAVWFFYSLVKIKDDERCVLISFILFGLSFHIHLSLLLFVPILFWILIRNRGKISGRIWLLSIASFLILISPLILFDFIHNFDNIRAPFLGMLKISHTTSSLSPVSRFDQLILIIARFVLNLDSLTRFVALQKLIGFLILLALGAIMHRHWKQYSTRIMGVFLLLFVGLFLIFPGPLQDYHAVVFFPFLSVFIALGLTHLPKSLVFVILTLFVIFNLYAMTKWSTKYRLETKKKLIKDSVGYLDDKRFYLGTARDYIDFGGWRYLFQAYGKTPAQSAADPTFGWIYSSEIAKVKPPYKVIVSDSDVIQTGFMRKYTENGLFLYILKNE